MEGKKLLLDVSYNKIYYGSPSLNTYWEHLAQGDVFEVAIIEQVSERSELRKVEARRLIEVDAANNPDYYNLTNNTLYTTVGKGVNYSAIINPYGETQAEYASRNSQLSKRDGSAKELGFDNFGEFHRHILERLDAGENWSQIARSHGKHKGYARVSMRSVNLDNFRRELSDLEAYSVDNLRKMIMKGCSVQRAAEVFGVEFPTARILIGNYHYEDVRRQLCAYNMGLTGEELQIKIMTMVLEGKTVAEVALELNLSRESAYRYFYKCLRTSLRTSDIKSRSPSK